MTVDSVPAPVRPILDLVRGQRTGRIVGAVLCLVIAILFELPESTAFCDWMNMQGPEGAAVWILRVPVLGFVLAGAWLMAKAVTSRPEDAPVVRLLLEAPESIVWVHTNLAIERKAYGATVGRSRYVFLLTTKGTGLSVVAEERQIDAVLDGLEKYLPHATFGFTPERQAKYRKDPELLRVPAESAYRGALPADRERLRSPKGAPFGVGAVVVFALLALRMVLLAPTCGTAGGTRGGPRLEPVAIAPTPAAVALPAAPAAPESPGDLALGDAFAYYTVPGEETELVALSKSVPDARRVARERTLAGFAVAGGALYYVAKESVWKVPKPYEDPEPIGRGLYGAYHMVVIGKHAYVLVASGIAQVDLATGETSQVVNTPRKVIASDGARVLFASDTLSAYDDRTGKTTTLLPDPFEVDEVAACGRAVYVTGHRGSADGALFALAAPNAPLADVPSGSSIACDASAVYWVDASSGFGVIKRRTAGGSVEIVTGAVPFGAKLAVDKDEVWFTVARGVRHVPKRPSGKAADGGVADRSGTGP